MRYTVAGECQECPRNPIFPEDPAFVGFELDVNEDGYIVGAECEAGHILPDSEADALEWLQSQLNRIFEQEQWAEEYDRGFDL